MDTDLDAETIRAPASAQAAVRVGLVGANPDRGWGSGVHRRVISLLPELELSAVCTTRASSAQAAKVQFGARHAFTDSGELAAHPDVDLVSVCVLAPHHYSIARAALDAGKHVYCEWPLALTPPQAEELAALAAERGVKAMIGLHLRGAPALRYAAELIRQGFLGRVTGVNLNVRVVGSITRAMAQRAGGTTLISIYGGHLLDAADHYFGSLTEWSATAATHLPPFDEQGAPVERDAADQLVLQGKLEGGALFSLDLSGGAPAGLGSVWRIEGSEGVLVLSSARPDMPAMEALALSGARLGEPLRDLEIPPEYDCSPVPAEPLRYPAYPGVEASRDALVSIGVLYQRLARAVREDGPVEPDFARAAKIQKLVAEIENAVAGPSSGIGSRS
jgi:predicted dehydrogenase